MSTNFQNQDSPFSASGRFGRLSFLAWNFLLIIFTLGANLVSYKFLIRNFSLNLLITYNVIILLVVLIIYFIFSIKRLHDRNQTGWLSLLNIIPIISTFFYVYLIVSPGTGGQNNFGFPRKTHSLEKILAWIFIPLLCIATILSILALPQIIKNFTMYYQLFDQIKN